MVTKWLQAGIRQSGPGEMPTCRGVLGAFEGLPRARNADFAKGDVICVTRTVVTQASRPFPAASLPLPFEPNSIHWAGTPTNTVDGGGGPNWSTEIGPWSRLRPLGVKPATFPPGNNRPAGQPLSPNPTADLVGSHREDTAEL